MVDSGPSADRLDDLRHRWHEDPTSRIFVQLAEEHRRRGESRQALEVLERGLEHHPSYLSARVALARCQLDLERTGDALEHLHEVLEKDPTHLLAGKLVIEAHLARGDRTAAREALDRYRLLGAPDEEVEELSRRLAGRQSPREGPPAGPTETPSASRTPDPSLRQGQPPADLDSPSEPVFALPARRLEPQLPWTGGNGGDRRELRGASEPPLRVGSAAAREARYLRGLEGDLLGVGPAEATEALPGGPAGTELSPGDPALDPDAPASAEEPLDPGRREAEAASPGETPAAGDSAASPEPGPPIEEEADGSGPGAAGEEPPRAERGAEVRAAQRETATLGDLYLRQGHPEEAAAIYRAVLAREPGHEGARRGLDTLELRRRSWVTAEELLGEEPDRAEGLTATKRTLLRRYLARLKSGG